MILVKFELLSSQIISVFDASTHIEVKGDPHNSSTNIYLKSIPYVLIEYFLC